VNNTNPRVEFALRARAALHQREAALSEWIEALDAAQVIDASETTAMTRAIFESDTGDDLLHAMEWREKSDRQLDLAAAAFLHELGVTEVVWQHQMDLAAQEYVNQSQDE
jgi:hypothetical protein